ncbi:MAG TPA: hypothetical protein PKO09_13760 [Anaerolineae bacterium]|nr:hypothetical protein [Anaerolineae bacterium]
MHPQKRWMLAINVLGGMAVLGSYALGLAGNPAAGDALWGGVPDSLRPAYTAGMLLAALGYLTFLYFLLFRLDPDQARIGGRFGYGLFLLLIAAILIPSALWMPLTVRMVQQPAPALWAAIRLVLAVVGLAAVGLLLALVWLRPRQPRVAYWAAVTGAALSALHTGVLDALLWTALFPA